MCTAVVVTNVDLQFSDSLIRLLFLETGRGLGPRGRLVT